MQTTTPAQVALLVTREQHLGLALAPTASWHDLYGLRMLRLELPSAVCAPGADARKTALALSPAVCGRPAQALPCHWIYGPSSRHAIDRIAATEPTTAPFLRFERMLPAESETGAPLRRIAIEVYRAALEGEPLPNEQATAGLLWLPVAALRRLVAGASISELLALHGVSTALASGVALPGDGVVYLPSEYGERMLARIAAKYGESAIFTTAPSAS